MCVCGGGGGICSTQQRKRREIKRQEKEGECKKSTRPCLQKTADRLTGLLRRTETNRERQSEGGGGGRGGETQTQGGEEGINTQKTYKEKKGDRQNSNMHVYKPGKIKLHFVSFWPHVSFPARCSATAHCACGASRVG